MRAIYRPKGAALEYAPFACNLYTGCAHGCLYCYGPATLHVDRATFHGRPHVRPGILDALRRDAERLCITRAGLDTLVGTTDPVLLCFTCDPYQPDSECDSRPTREAISILCDYNIPVHVLTKGGMRAARDFDLLRQNADSAFGTTLVFWDDRLRATWEPGAASVAWRVEAIKLARSLGIRTWVSVEPVVDPAEAILVIQSLAPWVDEFRVGKLNHIKPPEPVDWHEWAPRLLEALQESGRHYLVKESLRPYLQGELHIWPAGKKAGT